MLTYLAADYWPGVKVFTTFFEDATRYIRIEFGTKVTATRCTKNSSRRHRMSRQIFLSTTQLLPPNLPVSVQLHMFVGLLHRKVRNNVRKANFSTFDELLNLSRAAEEVNEADQPIHRSQL